MERREVSLFVCPASLLSFGNSTISICGTWFNETANHGTMNTG